ncbi:MAG TPA: hypothetical protein VF808_15975 [Ktedonobacterales bacterium]
MFDPNANTPQNQPLNQSGQAQDPTSAYSSLDLDQRALVAQAFIQRLAGKNDPLAQQYSGLDPNSVTPQQLAEIHQYVAQNHPDILGDVLQHPVMTDNLGSFAASELNRQSGGNMGATPDDMSDIR